MGVFICRLIEGYIQNEVRQLLMFKNIAYIPSKFIMSLLIGGMLTSCYVSPVVLTPSAESFATLTWMPTAGSVLSTRTPVPTSTPTFTLTPILTRAPLLTWTPRPTLPPAEAEALVLDLLTNNAGCQLPCWWGFTPGRTTWQEARSFLATFASDIYSASATDRSYEVYIHVPERISPRPLRHIYTVKDGIIDNIEIHTGNSLSYWLHTFLSSNGQPGEVWLSTGTEPRDGYLWFSIVLFYPDQGIVSRYDEPFAKVKGNQVEGCPHRYLFPTIILWAPENKVTFNEALNWVDPDAHYLLLEEAAGMNVKTFYETFKNLETSTCLKTPVELWS